ncbi:MAG: hypothetical protein KGL39_32225 [Patescibacteria group bacterium]|nr:hypothetical protein [Patescibacteria group bacterium]
MGNQLSQQDRDALPPEHFAVPKKRKLPIPDERHTRLAWDMVEKTKGLTPAERSDAYRHIRRRAKELGIDTTNWELHASADLRATTAFQLSAMSLNVPDVEDHPNRMPFSGILTRVDEPSDDPPGGSSGKRVLIPSAVAEGALETLLGMAVDYKPDLSGHDPKNKIGVITEATVEGNAIHIAGFLYAADFPEVCEEIHAQHEDLGFSYECRVAVDDQRAPIWVVNRIVFTGAAILYKKDAAYKSTSLAASADVSELTDMEIEKILEAINKLSASVDAQGKQLAELKAGHGASLSGPIIDQVTPHVGACNAAADAMEKAGVGGHPSLGHAAAIRKVATSMLTAAVAGKLPHIYRDHDYLEGGSQPVKSPELIAAEKANAELKDHVKTLTDSVASLGTQVTDLKAAATKQTTGQEPERKTVALSAEGKDFLSKYSLTAGDDNTVRARDVDKALAAAGVTGIADRLAAKLKLQASGLKLVA